MSENVTLRPAQRKAIKALLTGTVEDAAEAANRTTRTVYRWLREPVFQRELARLERDALAALNRGLLRLTKKSLDALEGALDDPEMATKLRGSDVHLKHLLRYAELAIIERQIAELEEERKEWTK